MLQALEHLTFKGEAFPVVFIRVDHFFERKAFLGGTLISHQVDRTGPALTEQGLDHIATSRRVLYGDSCWEDFNQGGFSWSSDEASFDRKGHLLVQPRWVAQLAQWMGIP